MSERIASIFIDTPSFLDRKIRGCKEFTYVTEYKWDVYMEYGGIKQKRHQRRYATVAQAMRRLRYVILKYEPEKAFILSMPVDVPYMKKLAVTEHVHCKDCGSSRWVLNDDSE